MRIAILSLFLLANLSFGQTILPNNTDLSTYKFAANTKYVAVNGNSTYRMSSGLTLANLPNVSIRLLGSKVSISLPAGTGSAVIVRNSPGAEIAGMDIVAAPTGATVVSVQGSQHCNLHDITTDVQVEQVAQFDQSSDWATCTRLVANKPTGSRLLYFLGTQHILCQYCKNSGSLGEDGIRFSGWTAPALPGAAHRNPRYVLISHCSLATIFQPNKQSATISMRNVGDGTPDDYIEISDCDLDGWVRGGQATTFPTVFNLRFNHNVCHIDRNGITQLSLMAATMVQCDGNTFYVDNNQRPIGWDHISCKVCVPTNTTVLKMDPSVTAKPLMIEIRTFSQTNGANTTVKVRPDYSPPPKTLP